MYGVPGGYPQATPQGPRSLHFRGKRSIPRLPELALSAAALGLLKPLSAIRSRCHRGGDEELPERCLPLDRGQTLQGPFSAAAAVDRTIFKN